MYDYYALLHFTLQKMCVFLTLHSIDSAMGRVDKDSFPVLSLMELLIEGILNKHKISGDSHELKPIHAWKGAAPRALHRTGCASAWFAIRVC